MAGNRRLVVEILGDAKGLGAAMGEAEKATGQLGVAVGNEVKGIGGAFDTLTGKADMTAVGFDGMNTKVNAAMLGAGAAVGAFALQSITKFQETALEAGKFGEASGLGVDAASRWIAVGDDIGLAAGTMEGAFQKFNIAVASGKPALDEYGVTIARAKDGTIDANETFINAITTIGKIPDPTKRAQAAQELFGRSYGEVSELMTKSAGELHEALGGVSDAQVISDEELQQARDYRDSLDQLGDMVGDFQIAIGQKLVPVLIDMAAKIEKGVEVIGKLDGVTRDLTGGGLVDWLGRAVDFANPLDQTMSGLARTFGDDASAGERAFGVLETLSGIVPGLGEGVSWLGDKIFPEVTGSMKDTSAETEALAEKMAMLAEGEMLELERVSGTYATAILEGQKRTEEFNRTAEEHAVKLEASQRAASIARDRENELAEAAHRVEQRTRDQLSAWDDLTRKLEAGEGLNQAHGQLEQLAQKIWDTTVAVNEGSLDQQTAMRDVATEIFNTKQKVIDYATELGKTPDEIETLLKLVDNGGIDALGARLDIATRNRNVQISLEKAGAPLAWKVGQPSMTEIQIFDQGGVVQGRRGSPVLALVHAGETILPTHKETFTAGGVGGGGVTVILQVAGSVVAQRDLEKALADGIYEAQRRGAIVTPLAPVS